jgi:acyl-CoA thioesterase-1
MRLRIILLSAILLSLALSSCSTERPVAYVSLGDSLAVGVGSSDPLKLSYAPLYRNALEEETGRKVRLLQLGMSGETSASFIGNYPGDSQLTRAEEALHRNPGATVTLSLGGNDLMQTGDYTNAEREAAIAAFGQNLDFILETLNEASSPAGRITVLAYYNPSPGSFTDRWVGQLNEEIRAVSEENGARVAAGDRAFRDHEGVYTRHNQYPWDVHPTDAGYEALAEAFIQAAGD